MGILVTLIHSYYLSTHDLAVFVQSFWSTIHSQEFFYNSIDPVSSSLFGAHNSPVLLVLLPLFLLFPHPLLFPVISTVLLAIAAVPLFYLTRTIYSDRFSCIIVAVYLLAPSIHGINLYNFSAICFVPLLFFLCWYGLVSEKWKVYFIAGLCLILVREDIAPLAVMIGLYGLLWSGKNTGKMRACHILLMVLGVLFFLLSTLVLIPSLSSDASLSSQYSHDLISNLSLYSEQRLELFWKTFAPLLFLPFAAPEVLLIGVFQFLEVFLSPYYTFLDLQYHYPGMFEPVLIVATVYGIRRLSLFFQNSRRFMIDLIEYSLLGSAIIGFLLISSSLAYVVIIPDYWDTESSSRIQTLDAIVEKIPPGAVVVTQDNIISHLSMREKIYLYGYHPEADFLIVETGTGYANPFQNDIEKYKGWIPVVRKNEVVVLSNPMKPENQEIFSGI